MKKLTSFILALFMLFSLCACKKHEHTWVDATCTEPKTCSECGETEGEALGHLDGDWTVVKEATLTSKGQEHLTCSRCGIELDTRSAEKDISYENGAFNFTKQEFIDYLRSNVFNSKVIITDNNTQDPLGGASYGIAFEKELQSALSLKENDQGKVSEITVWGDGANTVYLSFMIFAEMCGIDSSDRYSEFQTNMTTAAKYTVGDLTVNFKSLPDGFGAFTITGA